MTPTLARKVTQWVCGYEVYLPREKCRLNTPNRHRINHKCGVCYVVLVGKYHALVQGLLVEPEIDRCRFLKHMSLPLGFKNLETMHWISWALACHVRDEDSAGCAEINTMSERVNRLMEGRTMDIAGGESELLVLTFLDGYEVHLP